MGLFRSTGRFIVDTAKLAAGGESIRVGHRLLKKQWNNVTKKPCPKCSRGRLFSFYGEPIDGVIPHCRGCDLCDYYEAWDAETDEESMERMRKIARERLYSNKEQIEDTLRSLKITSRWWYAVCLMCLCYATYTVLTHQSILIFLNTMAGALFFFMLGFSASYRHWQVKEQLLFMPGAFWKWVRLGIWLV